MCAAGFVGSFDWRARREHARCNPVAARRAARRVRPVVTECARHSVGVQCRTGDAHVLDRGRRTLRSCAHFARLRPVRLQLLQLLQLLRLLRPSSDRAASALAAIARAFIAVAHAIAVARVHVPAHVPDACVRDAHVIDACTLGATVRGAFVRGATVCDAAVVAIDVGCIGVGLGIGIGTGLGIGRRCRAVVRSGAVSVIAAQQAPQRAPSVTGFPANLAASSADPADHRANRGATDRARLGLRRLRAREGTALHRRRVLRRRCRGRAQNEPRLHDGRSATAGRHGGIGRCAPRAIAARICLVER